MLKELEIAHIGLVGEFDTELDVQIAKVVVPEGWHPLAFNDFDCIWEMLELASLQRKKVPLTRLNNLARVDVYGQPSIIQVLDKHLTASKRCE